MPGWLVKGLKIVASIVLTIVLGALGLGVYVLSEGGVMEDMPSRALIFYRPAQNVYASPPCVMAGNTSHEYARITRLGSGKVENIEALEGESALIRYGTLRTMASKPDERCREASGYSGTNNPMWRELIGWKAQSRWDDEGEWRW